MKTGFLANIFAGKGAEIIESVGKVADKFITTKEEKMQFDSEVQKELNRHIEAMQIEANKELEILSKDVADARQMNSKIQDSDHASWLSKNVAYLLDLFLAILWGTITIILFLKLFKIGPENVDLISLLALHGTVTAVFMISVQFHRGSSIGSERKQRQLERLQK